MSPLQILQERHGAKTLILTIIGQMDESNIDEKSDQIYELIDNLPMGGNLIMNFSGLEYMNSKSIGYTTDFFNKINEKNGKLIIAEAQSQILDILNVVGLTHVIPFVDSVQEAKNMIQDDGSSNMNSAVRPVNENNMPKVAPPTVVLASDSGQSLKDKIAQEISMSLGKKQEIHQNLAENTIVLTTPPTQTEAAKPTIDQFIRSNNNIEPKVVPTPEPALLVNTPTIESSNPLPVQPSVQSPTQFNSSAIPTESLNNQISTEKKSAEMLGNQNKPTMPTAPVMPTIPNKVENKKEFPFFLIIIIVAIAVFLFAFFR